MLAVTTLSAGAWIFGALGVIGAIASAIILVIGSRAKTLATLQDQTITALDARVAELESQIAEAIRRDAANRTLLIERDHRIESLTNQVRTLQEIVTSKDAIEALGRQLTDYHQQVWRLIGTEHRA